MLSLLLTALVLQAPRGPAPAAPPQPQVERASPRAAPVPPAPPPAPAPPAAGPLLGDWGRSSGKRVTLDDTYTVADALKEIADEADWNLVVNAGRAGSKQLVLSLREVPAEDALREVLAGTGLVAVRSGDTVRVVEAGESAAASPVLSGFDRPTGKRFSGDFEDAPVDVALRQIARAAGLSIVLPPGGHGTITAHFESVPAEDALRAVLAHADLVAERQGQLVTVRPAAPGLQGLAHDAQRVAEQAMREAGRELERAQREARDEAHPLDAARDRQATGQDVVIRAGEAARDVQVVNGNLTLEGGAEARDVAVIRGNLLVQGGASVRDAAVVLGKATLGGGAAARQVAVVGGDAEIGPGAEVSQDVTSVGGRVQVDPSADVGGASHAIRLPSFPDALGFAFPHLFGGGSFLFGVLGALVKFVVLFVLGLLVLSVFPRRVEAVTGAMVASPARSVLAGVLGSFALPILVILLIATVVGILLVPVLILAVIAGALLGVTALTYEVGRLVPLQAARSTPALQLAIGTAVYAAVTAIPFVGVMAAVTAWLVVLGAVIRSRFGQQGPPVLGTTLVPPVQGPA